MNAILCTPVEAVKYRETHLLKNWLGPRISLICTVPIL